MAAAKWWHAAFIGEQRVTKFHRNKDKLWKVMRNIRIPGVKTLTVNSYLFEEDPNRVE